MLLRPLNAPPRTANQTDQAELLRATQMLSGEQAMLQAARAGNMRVLVLLVEDATYARALDHIRRMLTGLLAGLLGWVLGCGLQLDLVVGIGCCSLGMVLQALVQDRAWQRAEACWQRRVEQMHCGDSSSSS